MVVVNSFSFTAVTDSLTAQPLQKRVDSGAGVKSSMNAAGSTADQAVVVRVGADPEPMHAIGGWQTKCAVLQPDSGAVDPLARQQLEMKRGVLGVRLEQPEVLVGKIANINRQGPVAAPEPARSRVVHKELWGWLQ